ncbi:hypothetical protein DSL72_004043 [Monilinia vaccinii-corymbosi]|uniref:Uncharacterized protein n=1 Tax=Monilinia vaccinii-corymbosi TaxID=61207 RepID=A0A8A3P8G4_9HELO|nr:hypothetical protein DSL72_004043 [Monilinia vaccinii-corymbosi]
MKGRPIDQIVFEYMFPKPKTGDPQNFQGLLQRSLVPEVRHETQAFYGHLTSQEAKYPGLDYSYPPHRARLSRFPWHRRLFRAFDSLNLTKHEIATLTKWEGTRWAKERFEKEQGIVIRDTTGDGIEDWVPPMERSSSGGQYTTLGNEEELEEDGRLEENDAEEDGESDTEITSVGTALNERLRAAAAQRAAGNLNATMDPEWEEWLKDAVEGNIDISNTELSPDANIMGTRPVPSSSRVYTPSAGIYSPSGLTVQVDITSTRRVQRRPVIHRPFSEAIRARNRPQYSITAGDNYYRNSAAQNAEPRNP